MAVDERTIDERWQDYWRDKRGTTRYDLKLWIGHLFEGATYLPS